MRKTKLMPIVPMAYGGDMSGKGLRLRRKLLAGGNPSEDTSGTDPVDAGLTVGPGVSAYNWADPTIPPGPTGKGTPTDWAGLASNAANAVLPFASNIVNSLRTPPQPADPHLVNPVVLSKIRLDATRNQVRNAARAQDLNADRSLDEQSAAAVRSSNLAKTMNQEGQISEQEGFLNARQRAESAGMNLNVDSMNAAALNKQGDERVQRQLAIQREQSSDLANASDKAIAMGNERAKANLDLQKLETLSQMWKESGVYDRMMRKIKNAGVKDPTGVHGQMGWLGDMLDNTDERAMGGTLSSPMVGKHPTRNSNLHQSRIGLRKVLAFGGEDPGKRPGLTTQSMVASKASGVDYANLADKVNGILASGNMPAGGVDPQYRGMMTDAYTWSQTNHGTNPEARISSWYARPKDVNNPTDMLRGKLGNIDHDPIAYYHNTPDQNLQMRQGLQPAFVNQNVETTNDVSLVNKVQQHAFGGYRGNIAKGYLSPFGNTRSIGMGPGIMHDKYNPKHISHVPHNMLADGGDLQPPDKKGQNTTAAAIMGATATGQNILGMPRSRPALRPQPAPSITAGKAAAVTGVPYREDIEGVDDFFDPSTRSPIQVHDKNDPRLKAYKDSLDLYNWSWPPTYKTNERMDTPYIANGAIHHGYKGYAEKPAVEVKNPSNEFEYFPVFEAPRQPYVYKPGKRLALGGPKTDGSAGDDLTWTNYGDATPDIYRDGGPWQEEWKHGGHVALKPRLSDHSMWKQPYKENALTNNDPNPYQPTMAMGGNTGFDFSGETSARDMSMWNRKQWMDEGVGRGEYASGGWISKAVNPAHKGYCTPLTKSTCTPRRKAFAMTMKKHHGFHAMGGNLKPVY